MTHSLAMRLGETVLPMTEELLQRYNVPGPRYTSYPTVPEWSESFGEEDADAAYLRANQAARPVSLYLHIPFCESQCWFCGCFMKVVPRPKRRGDREEADGYLTALRDEIDWLRERVSPSRPVVQIHLGGGTPTYLSELQLEGLARHLLERFPVAAAGGGVPEVSIEIDPRVTSPDKVRLLANVGFNRISIGVQDFDRSVQELINRTETLEEVRELVETARDVGFVSVNIDLIYGLPSQQRESFERTLDGIVLLRPDRIAMYSYAHVPWLKKPQRVMEAHLPEGAEKFRIFASGIERLTREGYRYIGMDHFALETDELVAAQEKRTLHRNFQGYTTHAGCDLYGLGVSAITKAADCYFQNTKSYEDYERQGDRPIVSRGTRLTAEDRLRRDIISRLLCHLVLDKREIEQEHGIASFDERFGPELERLAPLEADGLVALSPGGIRVAPLGRIFIRNIAMVFDAYFGKSGKRRFSKTL